MEGNDEIISTLNDLIETSRDGEEVFLTAAKNVDNAQLKTFFLQRSEEVHSSVGELQELVRSLGGKPATSTTLSATLHRRWIDIKAAVSRNDNLSVLNEIERAEDIAVSDYHKASQQEMPTHVRFVVVRQLEGAKRNHDQVKRLRDAIRAVAY